MRAAAILGLLVPIVACTPSAEAVRDDPVVHAPGSGLAAPTSVPALAAHANYELVGLGVPGSADLDRVREDLRAVERVAELFPLAGLAKSFAAIGVACTRIDQAFGFEVDTCDVAGGYGECRLELHTYQGDVFAADGRCSAVGESGPELRDVLGRIYERTLVPRGFSVHGNVATISIREAVVRERALAAIAADLGPLSRASVPAELAEDVALLHAPDERVAVGRACGYAGSPPAGNLAMQRLVAAERDDLLRDLMQGGNAGGRIYGYIGLRLLGRNTPIDDRAYDRITALELDIPTCGGCSGSSEKASDIDLAQFVIVRRSLLERD